MISSFDRQLRRKNYGQSIACGHEFARVRETLAMKQRQLKREGKGNLPNKSEPLTDEDLNQLWDTHQLGSSTPDSILQTLWLYNTVHFGLRSCQEHRDMCWGDVSLKRDDNGHEYLQFCERQTKTRSGENPKDVRVVKPRLWANIKNPDQCPVKIYKIYAEKRPTNFSSPEHPFYIAATAVHQPSPRDIWFKRNPVGINKLGSMMKWMCKQAGLNPDKKLSNHSARKYLVQKLNDNNVPANQIMQISGHKNIASINNYSHINEKQHRHISNVLHSNVSNAAVDTENAAPNTFVTQAPAQSFLKQSSNTRVNSESSTTFRVSGGFQSIFGAQILGGTFHVHLHQNNASHEQKSPARKRLRIAETDSDSE